MNKTITIIKFEPHKEPEVIDIEDSTETYRSLVGGYLEGLALSPTAHIIINEDGKLMGLEPNRRYRGDVLVGTILIVGTCGPDIVSLTQEQINQYTEQFKTPEEISKEEVLGTMGLKFIIF